MILNKQPLDIKTMLEYINIKFANKYKWTMRHILFVSHNSRLKGFIVLCTTATAKLFEDLKSQAPQTVQHTIYVRHTRKKT